MCRIYLLLITSLTGIYQYIIIFYHPLYLFSRANILIKFVLQTIGGKNNNNIRSIECVYFGTGDLKQCIYYTPVHSGYMVQVCLCGATVSLSGAVIKCCVVKKYCILVLFFSMLFEINLMDKERFYHSFCNVKLCLLYFQDESYFNVVTNDSTKTQAYTVCYTCI